MGLKKAGIVFYLERVYSVVTGALFVLLITRNLTPSEFGAWSVVSSILSYASLATIVNYWVTRFRARGDGTATSSGLVLAVFFSSLSIIILLFLSHGITNAFKIPYEIVLLSALYIPFYYINSALYSSLYAVNPTLSAVTEFVFETTKLILAVVFATTLHVTLYTAMLAVLGGHAAQTLILLLFTREDLKHKPSLETAKRIILYSWVNLIGVPASLIALADIPILSHFASNRIVAYYTVVLTYTNMISYSYVLSRGLYPSLLSNTENAKAKLDDTLRLTFLMGVPAMFGAIALAPNLLYILNPDYMKASSVLRVASLTALLGVFNAILSDTVQGLESRDTVAVHPRMLAETAIFKTTLLGVAKAAIGIAGVFIAVLYFGDSLTTAVYARIAWLLAEILVTLGLYTMTRGLLDLKSLASGLSRYVASSIPMVLVALVIDPWRIREALLAVLLGGAVYFATLYLIDSWFRGLMQSIARSLKTVSVTG